MPTAILIVRAVKAVCSQEGISTIVIYCDRCKKTAVMPMMTGSKYQVLASSSFLKILVLPTRKEKLQRKKSEKPETMIMISISTYSVMIRLLEPICMSV